MKKICFIIPYFGKFNNYFPLFLESCKNNPTINWLIYTDDKTDYNYPKNVKVKYTTFEEIKDKFRRKLGCDIALNKPYKLCDFRPAYGYCFEEDLKLRGGGVYDFWGYCDVDLIFGDIKKFFTCDILDKYDVIGFYGHCTIFRNNARINDLFKHKGIYKDVFTNERNCGFDEGINGKRSISAICIENGIKCLFHNFHADIDRGCSNFRLNRYDFKTLNRFAEDRQAAFFVYDHGRLLRYYKNRKQIDEYLYIHLLRRPMKVRTINRELFKIIPNSFDDFNYRELSNIKKVKTRHPNFQYFKTRKDLIAEIIKRKFMPK